MHLCLFICVSIYTTPEYILSLTTQKPTTIWIPHRGTSRVYREIDKTELNHKKMPGTIISDA